MAIQVNPAVSPRIITVPESDGESISIQSLVNQIRDWEDNQANLSYDRLLSASGKEDLGGDVKVGITAKLENTRIKFEARSIPTTCYVGGGNLVAVDSYGNSMFPIEPSTNVTVQLAQSSSATIITTGGSALTEEEHNELMKVSPVKAKTDQMVFTEAGKVDATAANVEVIASKVKEELQSDLNRLLEMYKLLGLDPSIPLVVSINERKAGIGIIQKIEEGAQGTVTVTRQ